MRTRTIISLFQVLLATSYFLFSTQLFASDFHSPRTDALGGAGHASPLLCDSIFINPSFGSFTQTHSLSFNYMTYGNGTKETNQGTIPYYGHNINISVLDGTPESLFQAGVGYTRRDDSSIVHISASKQVIPKLSFGIGTKFIFPNDSSGTRLIEGTASGTLLLTEWLQASAILDNALGNAQDKGFYREYILGTKFNIMGIVLIYADPHLFANLPQDQKAFGYEAGVEFPFAIDVFLRGGIFKNSTIPYQAQRGDGYGLGFGWVAPKLSLDYAFSRAISPVSANSHNFGITVYF